MKKFILVFLLISGISTIKLFGVPASSYTIDLARSFSKDIFDLNGVPYLSPMVKAVNATSNSRFYSNAYVPPRVSSPYFKITINGMAGLVRTQDKYYSPQLPMDSFSINKLSKYGTININFLDPSKSDIKIVDTAGLINYLFKTIMFDGYRSGKIVPPERASTILGKDTTHLHLSNDILTELVKNHVIYQFLPQEMKDTLLNVIKQVPTFFTLPAGGNISTIIAGVPQLEIGSLYGTELLLRVIPPLDLGKYIGEFAFWGIGIKHSISQYFTNYYENEDGTIFEDSPFDMALQIVYQGTNLKNKVGVTQSDLNANAQIWNANLHFSKSLAKVIDLYAGISYNYIDIDAKFKYYLPVETQMQLGLLRYDPVLNKIMPPEPPDYPGDTKPQTTKIGLKNDSFQATLGLKKDFGKFSIFADYNISKFNIFTAGIQYSF